MDLSEAIVHALLQGLTTVLPLSETGHQVAARIWLGSDRGLPALSSIAQLGCLVALVVVVRQRLARAFTEGIRGLARPAILQSSEGGRDAVAMVLASLVAATSDILLRPYVSELNATPLVVGAGLLLTAAGLASTTLTPPPRHLTPAAAGALLVGLAHGLAAVPGASRIGAAFIVLRWLGVGGWRAAEAALLMSVPVMALQVARLALETPKVGMLGGGLITLVALLSCAGALLGASLWRALCERNRTVWLSLWLVPLALAVLGYGRALPQPVEQLPVRGDVAHIAPRPSSRC